MTPKQSEILELMSNHLPEWSTNHIRMDEISQVLHSSFPTYDWVGFYLMNDESRELHLGPYRGAPTDHVRIPYGRGICGQVAVSGAELRIDDVHAESNYIACSLDVKSEIVVPVYANGILVAQIDIDSHKPAAFSDDDSEFLGEIAERLGRVWD